MRRAPAACLLLVAGLLVAETNGVSLYEKTDPILELDVDTFGPAVYGQKRAFFVEFYSSWCGACQAYAPTFKEFARRLEAWSPLVQVTVLNCAEDKNMPICREHSINSFPTIKYFKYNSQDHNDGLLYQGDKHNIDTLALDVAGLVHADYYKQRPSGWPTFDHVDTSTTIDDIWRASGGAQLLGLVVQDEPATVSWAAAINFHSDKRVQLALARPTHPEVTRILGSTPSGPKFLLFKLGNPSPVYTSGDGVTWLEIREKLREALADAHEAAVQQAPAPAVNGLSDDETAHHASLQQFQVQNVDLTSALSYMLRREVPRRASIEGEDLAALKSWTHVLRKYAPVTVPLRRLLYRLDEYAQTKIGSLSGDEWTAKVEELNRELGNPLPQNVSWLACTGSKPHLRGYTCGVWTLMHAITVDAYKNDGHMIDVLEPFHQFIYRFLSCGECAQNFDGEAKNNQLSLVTRPEDVVLWLWRTHNKVNKRLSGSAGDDPKHPKQQFPPSSICPHCRDSSGNFDEAKTLEFLVSYYSDIRTDTIEPPPAYKISEFKEGKLVKAGNRHLNPKFNVGHGKVDREEVAAARMRNEFDASPQRKWRNIEPFESTFEGEVSGHSRFFFFVLTIAGVALLVGYFKYRRNRSKFWKTFYYYNDYKL